jgi:hypothetical protein
MTKAGLVVLLALVGVFASTQEASAKGGIFIYNTGQKAFETGALPAPYDAEPELAGYRAGYICDVTGVFWSYFSVRNCKAVAFKGDTYTDQPEIQAAVKAKYSESDMDRGIWGRFGWMLMALAIVAGIALWIKSKVSGNDED